MCVFIFVSESQKGRLIRTNDLVGVEIKIDFMVNDGDLGSSSASSEGY